LEDTLGNCIVAYKIDEYKISLIIKHYSYGYSEIDDEIYYYEVKYFNIEIIELGNEIKCTWEDINSINDNGFIFNGAYLAFMCDKPIDIMLEPSLDSEIYTRIGYNNYKKIKILAIRNGREIIDNRSDFWYKIEYDNKEFWVYGYNISFSESIKINE
jgi:hypothetical protein